MEKWWHLAFLYFLYIQHGTWAKDLPKESREESSSCSWQLLVCLIESSEQAFEVDTLVILFFTVTVVLCLGTVLACCPSLNTDSGFLTLSNGLIQICSDSNKEKKKMCRKRNHSVVTQVLS